MKKLKSIFEGIFNTDQDSLSDAVTVVELENSKIGFGYQWQKIKSYEPSSNYTYDNGVLDCRIPGSKVDGFILNDSRVPILPKAVQTFRIDIPLSLCFSTNRPSHKPFSPDNFASDVFCPNIRLQSDIRNINFHSIYNDGSITIQLNNSNIKSCSFNKFTRLECNAADAPNLLKAFKSCKLPDLSSIRIAFANLYDLIHAVELVVDGYNIPGYTQSLSDKELINCITSYKKNRLAFDKGENLMNIKDPKTNVSKIAKLLGLFSACPKLQTIDLFSYAGSGMNFTFKQNGSNLETKLW